jgi:hypothetical protein
MGGTTPASGATCPPDLPISDCVSALLYPSHAPLADAAKGAGTWDFRATWAHVPSQVTSDSKPHSLLLYFHGHFNSVKVDQAGRSAKPDWASDEIFGRILGGGPCTPIRYKLAAAADGAPSRPIVLAPENANPQDRTKNTDGRFADPDGVAKYIGDCTQRLSRLTRHASCANRSSTYLPPNRVSFIRRIFIAGHSGGGITLRSAARSGKLLDLFPSDLVQLDCNYGHDGGGDAYATARNKLASAGLGLGNGRDQSRIIITTTGGSADGSSGTKGSCDTLVAKLRNDLRLTHTTVAYDQATKRPISPPDLDKVGGGIMQITHIADDTDAPSDDNLAFIVAAMQKCPIVYIVTNVAHDHNPDVFIPLVLKSAVT